MEDPDVPWRNTTHDWATSVDLAHLEQIRSGADRFAPGGTVHLVLEVVAYAADEADCGPSRVVITLPADGPVCVADDGRGTDTRVDHRGRVWELLDRLVRSAPHGRLELGEGASLGAGGE